VEQYSVQVASKLLQVASRAGAFQDPGVVQDALVVILFRWLLDELAVMRHNDDTCSEVFWSWD
jgi:hypothetical protein